MVGLGQTCGYFGYFLCYVTVVEDELFVIVDGVLSVEAEAEAAQVDFGREQHLVPGLGVSRLGLGSQLPFQLRFHHV